MEPRQPERGSLPTVRVAIVAAIVAALGITAFLGAAAATDRSSFCPTCHEMRPYHDAWTSGVHSGQAECIDCHVDAGYLDRLGHKFVALHEIYVHFFGDRAFPLARPADVPDSRCTGCHESIEVAEAPSGFSHAEHQTYESCQVCHSTAGHSVSPDALRQAGIFDQAKASARSARLASTAVAVVDQGAANVSGHVDVVCSRCHDLQATGCAACHQPKHEDRGQCDQCHRAGAQWRFDHPPVTGEHDWRRMKCEECHPDTLTVVSCTCHGGGTSFRED